MMRDLVPYESLEDIWIQSSTPAYDLLVGSIENLIKDAKKRLSECILSIARLYNAYEERRDQFSKLFLVSDFINC